MHGPVVKLERSFCDRLSQKRLILYPKGEVDEDAMCRLADAILFRTNSGPHREAQKLLACSSVQTTGTSNADWDDQQLVAAALADVLEDDE